MSKTQLTILKIVEYRGKLYKVLKLITIIYIKTFNSYSCVIIKKYSISHHNIYKEKNNALLCK